MFVGKRIQQSLSRGFAVVPPTTTLVTRQRITPSLVYVQTRPFVKIPSLNYIPSHGVYPVFSPSSALKHYTTHKYHCVRFNSMVNGTGLENILLEHFVGIYRVNNDDALLFNAASEVLNHSFMWMCLQPNGRIPSPWLKNYFSIYFGSMQRFEDLWVASCRAMFGSGWCWLVLNNGYPTIVNTPNAGNPIGRYNIHALLAIDLWEHAYSEDYGRDRDQYVRNWLRAVNWELVEKLILKLDVSKRISQHKELALSRHSHPDDRYAHVREDNPFLLMQLEHNMGKKLEPEDVMYEKEMN